MRKIVAVRLRKAADAYAKMRQLDPRWVYQRMKKVWNQTPRNLRGKQWQPRAA